MCILLLLGTLVVSGSAMNPNAQEFYPWQASMSYASSSSMMAPSSSVLGAFDPWTHGQSMPTIILFPVWPTSTLFVPQHVRHAQHHRSGRQDFTQQEVRDMYNDSPFVSPRQHEGRDQEESDGNERHQSDYGDQEILESDLEESEHESEAYDHESAEQEDETSDFEAGTSDHETGGDGSQARYEDLSLASLLRRIGAVSGRDPNMLKVIVTSPVRIGVSASPVEVTHNNYKVVLPVLRTGVSCRVYCAQDMNNVEWRLEDGLLEGMSIDEETNLLFINPKNCLASDGNLKRCKLYGMIPELRTIMKPATSVTESEVFLTDQLIIASMASRIASKTDSNNVVGQKAIIDQTKGRIRREGSKSIQPASVVASIVQTLRELTQKKAVSMVDLDADISQVIAGTYEGERLPYAVSEAVLTSMSDLLENIATFPDCCCFSRIMRSCPRHRSIDVIECSHSPMLSARGLECFIQIAIEVIWVTNCFIKDSQRQPGY